MPLPAHHRDKLLAIVDQTGRRGLEIGALASPVLRRDDGDVLFADRLSTEDLRQAYAGAASRGGLAIGDLVEVDVAIGDRTLREALGERGPVDYIVASHVIEHLPDPVAWLQDLASCLREGGLLSLAVPDRRFTFDHFRQPTPARDWVEWHLAGLRRPSPGQVFDHVAHVAHVEAGAVWSGGVPRDAPPPGTRREDALAIARTAPETYHDVHCSVFTPASFAALLREVLGTGLLPFALARFEPTPFGQIEFYATLRKAEDLSAGARAATVPVLDPALHDAVPRGLRGRALLRAARRRLRDLTISRPR